MDTRFHTLAPDQNIAEAVARFRTASIEEGKKVFGMIVVDGDDRLVGMLSMYDILIFIQPKHASIWGEMQDVDPDAAFSGRLERIRQVQVGDLMTTEVVTLAPDTHLLVIADIMIKKHIRRLPVVEGRTVVGMVYVSDVFYRMLETLKE
jgi:CBS domain-containing protein